MVREGIPKEVAFKVQVMRVIHHCRKLRGELWKGNGICKGPVVGLSLP